MSTPYPPAGEQPPVGSYGNSPPGSGYSEGGQAYPGGYEPYRGPEGYGSGRPARNGLGWAALIVGILGLLSSVFVIGGVLGIVAIVLGVLAWKRARRGEATNGWAGIVGIVLGVLSVVVAAVVLTLGLLFADDFANYGECIDAAGQDTAAQQQCGEDFGNEVGNG